MHRWRPPEPAGGDDHADGVHADADDHERDAVVDQERGGAGGADEWREVSDVVRATGDHADGRGARTRATCGGGCVVQPVSSAELGHERDLGAEPADDQDQVVPVFAGLLGEVGPGS